jgi:hypothetical protein
MTSIKRAASISSVLEAAQPRSTFEEHDILSAPRHPVSSDSAATVSPPQPSLSAIHEALRILQPDSDTIDIDDTPATASTSPLLSQLGPISPVEEVVPAVHSTSSPSRRLLQHSLASGSSSSLATPSAVTSALRKDSAPLSANRESGQTCSLVLDWSRPRTSGAIFQSSSGVRRVHIEARPPHSISKASIERLKWKVPPDLLSSRTTSVASTKAEPAIATERVNLDNLPQLPIATTIPLPPNPI